MLALQASGASAEAQSPAQAAAPIQPTPEAVTKASRLARFAPFVQWPETAFESPTAAFSLCILGADPLGTAVDEAVRGQKVGQHPIEVKRLAKTDKVAGCHLLYLGALKGAAAADALAAVKGAPVLTVTDAETPDDPRGVITFHTRGRELLFAVDQAAARRNGLVVSSKLLSLAFDARRHRPRGGG